MIVIAIFLFIFTLVFIFALALCRSAALADREYERALKAEHKGWSRSPEWMGSSYELDKAPKTKPIPRLGHSGS